MNEMATNRSFWVFVFLALGSEYILGTPHHHHHQQQHTVRLALPLMRAFADFHLGFHFRDRKTIAHP